MAVDWLYLRLNEMYPNLQTEKNGPFLPQIFDQKPFCPNFNVLYLFKYRNSHWKRDIFGISMKFWVRSSKKSKQKLASADVKVSI